MEDHPHENSVERELKTDEEKPAAPAAAADDRLAELGRQFSLLRPDS